jgi:hypothetical protein
VALSFAVVAFFYCLVRCHFEESREVAVLASLLLILNPTFLTMLYRVYMSDFDYFVWATLSLGLYFMARRTRRIGLCAAAGLSLSLSVFFRNTNAIAFLAIGAYELASFCLRLVERARRRRDDATVEYHKPLGWVRAAVLVGAVLAGAIPFLWYNRATTGDLLISGYQYRLERESSAYFALWDARAVFSPHHLFTGQNRGLMSQGYTLSTGLARAVQGYPLLLLAPAGLLLMERRRLRPGLFLALWLGLFWGIYLCYRTIRADSFQFMCRKLSPALAPLAVGAAVALAAMRRKTRYITFAVLTLLSLSVTADFFVQFVFAERGPRAGLRAPGGPRPGARGAAPDQLLRDARRRLSQGDLVDAQRLVHEAAQFLAQIPPMAPERIRRATDELRPRVDRLADALREAAESGRALPEQQRRALAEQLRSLEASLAEQLPPPPGPGRRPLGRGELREPAGQEPMQEPGRPRAGARRDPRDLVRRLHALIDEARRHGIDVSEAEKLDEASKRAAQDGEWQENRRLLQQAIRMAERALRPRGPARRPRSGPGGQP